MRSSNSQSPTTSHSKRGLETTESTTTAISSRTTSAAIQRPVWRTGIALIASGGGPAEPAGVPAGSVEEVDRAASR